MRVSIIIPTIGRDHVLVETLRALTTQSYPDVEIILVDQNPLVLPGLKQFLELRGGQTPVIHRLSLGRASASAARNLGLIAATGPVVLFLDDDVEIPRRDFVEMHCRNYRMQGIDGVAGQILQRSAGPRVSRHRWSRNSEFGWLYFPLSYACRCIQRGVGGAGNLSVRRAAALAVGGMDEVFVKGAFREESDFIQRFEKAGHTIVFDPQASLIHLGEASGGIRTWVRPEKKRRLDHHLVGEWYFILRHARGWGLIHHLAAAIRNQFGNPSRLLHPLDFSIDIVRCLASLMRACSLAMARPKTLQDPRISAQYRREVPVSGR